MIISFLNNVNIQLILELKTVLENIIQSFLYILFGGNYVFFLIKFPFSLIIEVKVKRNNQKKEGRGVVLHKFK